MLLNVELRESSLERRYEGMIDAGGMEAIWSIQPDLESRSSGNSWWVRDDDELQGDDVPKLMGRVGF